MEKYNEDAHCRKCGHYPVQTKYNDGSIPFTPSGSGRETMIRTCPNCGYVWNEDPLHLEKESTNEQR